MFQSANGNIKQVVAFRLKPGTDILEGITEMCAQYGIQHGVIMSAIGSLNGATYCNPVPLKDKKAGYGYGDALVMYGPVELLSLSGMICRGVEGETLFHVHVCYSDQHGNARGGHLLAGNKVLLTVDVVVGELEGIHMGRRYDEDLELFLFHPEQK